MRGFGGVVEIRESGVFRILLWGKSGVCFGKAQKRDSEREREVLLREC